MDPVTIIVNSLLHFALVVKEDSYRHHRSSKHKWQREPETKKGDGDESREDHGHRSGIYLQHDTNNRL